VAGWGGRVFRVLCGSELVREWGGGAPTLLCIVYRQSPLGPVDPSFRTLSGRPKFTVRRHKFNKDSLFLSLHLQLAGVGLDQEGEPPPGILP